MQTLTKIPPPSFDLDSPNAINLIENSTANHGYYRDNGNNGARIDSKNDLNLREQEIKNILGSTYHQHDDSNFEKDGGEMCDTACQTR